LSKFPYKIIDLTHTLHKSIPTWTGSCGFNHEIKLDYADCEAEVKFRVQQVKMHAGIGTHIDSPAHAISGAATVDELELKNLVCPCICIKVPGVKEDFLLSVEDVLAFEKKYGVIAEGSFLIFYSGWDKHWDEPGKYLNDRKFPSVSEEAVLLFLERRITGLGIDTVSPDGPLSGFPVHKHLLGSGRYIVENVANANRLPEVGSFALVLPIKAGGLTEAPIRLIGLIEEKSF
jgi:kynurenine formamidase